MNNIHGNLWISDINAPREQQTTQFDTIISVCQENVADNVSCENIHFPLTDGPQSQEKYGGEFSYELFEKAVDECRVRLQNGNTILVHCHRGKSRSVGVCIAICVVEFGWTLSKAEQQIGLLRNGHDVNEKLWDFVEEYINHNSFNH